VIGRIPFDHVVNDALMEGKTVIEYGNSPPQAGQAGGQGNAEEAIREVWRRLQEALTDVR